MQGEFPLPLPHLPGQTFMNWLNPLEDRPWLPAAPQRLDSTWTGQSVCVSTTSLAEKPMDDLVFIQWVHQVFISSQSWRYLMRLKADFHVFFFMFKPSEPVSARFSVLCMVGSSCVRVWACLWSHVCKWVLTCAHTSGSCLVCVCPSVFPHGCLSV